MSARAKSLPGRVTHTVGDIILTLLAALGAVSMLLVVLTMVFGLSLVMFKTGSMSPTIPTGSVALVREIPAYEIHVGDVVTVERADALPVTHRVTSIQHGDTAETRVITMRGDANDADDPEPYTVTSVKLVLESVPGLARVIVWMSHPAVLGSITVAVSALVTWAFWPRPLRQPDEAQGGEDRKNPDRDKLRGPNGRHGRHRRSSTALLALAAVITATVSSDNLPAQAAEAEVVQGQYLTITSVLDPGMRSMEPGRVVHWIVGTSVSAPEAGAVQLAISATGRGGLELDATIDSCSVEWVGDQCASGRKQLTSWSPLPLNGQELPLLSFETNAGETTQRWLRFSAQIAPAADPQPGAKVDARFHASGHGESLVIEPGAIATTGASQPRWLLWLPVAAIGIGLTLAYAARVVHRRRRPR